MSRTPVIVSAGHEFRLAHIRDLEASPDAGPVWVLNSSRGTRRGDVVLTVARNSGLGSDTVVVPATWIPLDLTMMVSRSQLLRDNQFRQSILNGLLTLVNEDDATSLFDEHEDALKERQRLSNYMLVGAVAFQQQQAVSGDVEVFGDDKGGDDGIPAPVKNLIQRIELAHKNGELDDAAEQEFVAVLRNLGEQEVDVYKHIFHATAKLAPEVSKLAKRLAGK
jgi:hypothetical protein